MQGCEVHAIVRKTSDKKADVFKNKTVIKHICDDGFESIHAAMLKAAPTIVYHCASEFLVSHEAHQIKDLISNNILFPTHLLEAMVKCNVRKIVNTGSCWQNYKKDTYHPVNLYAATKQSFEDILEYYVDTEYITAVTLRLYDTYGENDSRKKIVNLLLNSTRDNTVLELSPGDQKLYLVHITDVVRAFTLCEEIMSRINKGHYIYSLKSKAALSLKELVAQCESIWGVKLPIVFGARPYRDREVMTPRSPLPDLPEFVATISLDDGLAAVYRAFHNATLLTEAMDKKNDERTIYKKL